MTEKQMLTKIKSSYKLLLGNMNNIENTFSKGTSIIKNNPKVISNTEYVLNNTFGFKCYTEAGLITILYYVYNKVLLGFNFNTKKNKISLVAYGIQNKFISPLTIYPSEDYFHEFIEVDKGICIGIGSLYQPMNQVALFTEEEVEYIYNNANSILKDLLSFDSFVKDCLDTSK